ncbi:sigma-70 family RNA polymerase sigma factor [Mucilaginibacter mali]|uniref:Sigma-70 family RNA polymerase sigma factor n=1 Tax=Mucilaginibacter mali TaxID=2740462 RepID=A0A7D4Q2C9_9SPHI|nr:sigma-70 family RNA polymerase sigma factor [Mucilaginibacter mali]QKJ31226.1 sigma-70 family RNA polymerase sigma factor [Mucilaginibacter mali]
MFQQGCDLWKLFLAGDKVAFQQLIAQHFRHLVNYGTKFTDDKELVKDTIQELFIRFWEKRANLSDDVNPRAYLTASLRRALHRKIQSVSRFQSFDDVENSSDLFDMELSVESRIIEKEYGRNIARAIAQNMEELPKRQKEVVYLKFFQEMSRDEISEVMGISAQTVSNLLQMALKNLRTRISKDLLVYLLLIFGNKRNLA